MADNYLERRMEDYRAGKLASKPRATTAHGTKKEGDVTINFKGLTVALAGGSESLVKGVVKRFRAADCCVALCHAESTEWTRFAQSTGCRYYPFNPNDPARVEWMLDDMTERRGRVDVIVDLRSVDDEFSEAAADEIALLLLLHSHPRLGFVKCTELEMGEE